MNALRGKMAWNYFCNNSLWSKHARIRFVIGRKGSYLWKNISPFISNIASDCHWSIGDGSTTTDIFCQNIALPCPKRLRARSIKEVLSTIPLRHELLHNVNPRILRSISDSIDVHKADRLVWDKDPSGIVTTKSFYAILNPNGEKIRKFTVI